MTQSSCAEWRWERWGWTDAYAAAMKEVNNWYFETMARNLETLPEVTEFALREMAERCPQKYGSAVGKAQSILLNYDKAFTPSYDCKEIKQSDGKNLGKSIQSQLIHNGHLLVLEDVKIFPNPTSDILTIQLPQSDKKFTWEVNLLNARGQLLKSRVLQGESMQLDLNGYPNGLYWIQLKSSGGAISKRVIIR